MNKARRDAFADVNTGHNNTTTITNPAAKPCIIRYLRQEVEDTCLSVVDGGKEGSQMIEKCARISLHLGVRCSLDPHF